MSSGEKISVECIKCVCCAARWTRTRRTRVAVGADVCVGDVRAFWPAGRRGAPGAKCKARQGRGDVSRKGWGLAAQTRERMYCDSVTLDSARLSVRALVRGVLYYRVSSCLGAPHRCRADEPHTPTDAAAATAATPRLPPPLHYSLPLRVSKGARLPSPCSSSEMSFETFSGRVLPRLKT